MRPPAGYSVRPAELGDLDAVVELLKATDRADAGVEDPVREHLLFAWERQSSFSLERDTRLVFAADDRLAAYANIEGSHPETSLEVWVRVHPEHRGRGLGSALLDWGEALCLDRSPNLPVLRDSIPHEDALARDLLERRGFAQVRTFWHMLRELDGPVEEVPPLDGIEIRRYEHPRDVRTLHDVLEESFREHWGVEPYPYEDHEREMAVWDRDLAWLALAGDRAIGGTLATIIEGSGWVDVIGVLEPWRGKGIGRALLLTQFRMLAARRAPEVALNVDSGNDTGAPSLYASAGMRVHRVWDVFEKRFGEAVAG